MNAQPNENLVHTILDNLSEAVGAYDLRRKLTYWNRGAELLTGYRAEEVLGRGCDNGVLAHVDEHGASVCAAGCMLDKAISQHVSCDAHLFILHKQGHRVPVHARFAPLVGRGDRIMGAIHVFRETSVSAVVDDRVRELEKLSFRDPLTNLANRRYTDMALQARCGELSAGGRPFGVVLLDIDNLKQINDHHGHDAGDRVLCTVARTLLFGSRPFDVKGRWGGDEFIAIVADVDRAGLSQAAERFRSLIESSVVRYGSEVIRTTVSVGAALARPQDDVLTLIRRADRELYGSKSRGKNRASVAGL